MIKYACKVDDWVGATNLIIKLKPKVVNRLKACRCVLWECRTPAVKEIWLLQHFLYDSEDNLVCAAFLEFWCNVIHCKSANKNGCHCYLCPFYA